MEPVNTRIQNRKSSKSVRPLRQGTGHNQSNYRSDSFSLAKNRLTVVSSFRDEDRFSGTISCKVALHCIKMKYKTLMKEQEIPNDQAVSLMHSCLTGMALDFFYTSINGKVKNMEEAFQKLQAQFNYFQHQAQARLYLNGISIATVKAEKSCSELVALETIHGRIVDTVPSCGENFQHDCHKQEFLANAVKDCEWASQTLQARLTPSTGSEQYDYNTLYSKLSTALTASQAYGKSRGSSSQCCNTSLR